MIYRYLFKIRKDNDGGKSPPIIKYMITPVLPETVAVLVVKRKLTRSWWIEKVWRLEDYFGAPVEFIEDGDAEEEKYQHYNMV